MRITLDKRKSYLLMIMYFLVGALTVVVFYKAMQWRTDTISKGNKWKITAAHSFEYGYRKALRDVTTGHYNPKIAVDSFKIMLESK